MAKAPNVVSQNNVGYTDHGQRFAAAAAAAAAKPRCYVDWQELEWQARSRHDTIGSFEIV